MDELFVHHYAKKLAWLANVFSAYFNNYSLFPRPKPEKKISEPIKQPVVERKPPEPYTPKPMIRKLPARKLSDTISLTMSITYAFLETRNESPLISL